LKRFRIVTLSLTKNISYLFYIQYIYIAGIILAFIKIFNCRGGNFKLTCNDEEIMKEMIYVFIFLGIYILVQVYVLPKMGIST